MRDLPSIVPAASEDYYIVVNRFGRHGTAFAETDLDRGNYETTIADLMFGRQDRDVPSELEDFIDRHGGRDRQLTLRLVN